MRLSQGVVKDIIKLLDFAIDECEWEPHSETQGELMAARAHASVSLNMLINPTLDDHYKTWSDDDE